MYQIGYLEDDFLIRENYVDLLESEGYKVLVRESKDSAISDFLEQDIDLAILDIELGCGEYAGLEVCKAVRAAKPTLPIIFLTSHTEYEIQARGWKLGADDYVAKETQLDLVLLRIQALLSRYEVLRSGGRPDVAEETSGQSPIHIDDDRLVVQWKGEPLNLSLTQFWLLRSIVEAGGSAVSHDMLQDAANLCVEQNTIVAHIRAIRSEFKRVDDSFSNIKTERGMGYRWVSI